MAGPIMVKLSGIDQGDSVHVLSQKNPGTGNKKPGTRKWEGEDMDMLRNRQVGLTK